MGTRATVQRPVQPEAVLKRLSPRLRSCVDVGAFGAGAADLVVFEPGEGHVVTSKDLQKGLAQRGDFHARLLATTSWKKPVPGWIPKEAFSFPSEATSVEQMRDGMRLSKGKPLYSELVSDTYFSQLRAQCGLAQCECLAAEAV